MRVGVGGGGGGVKGHRAPPPSLILQSVYIIENMILMSYLDKSYFVEAKLDMSHAQQVDTPSKRTNT